MASRSYYEKSQFYAYAFNSCKKGMLATGFNHIFLRVQENRFQMVQASNNEVISELDNVSVSCDEKGCKFTYFDLKTRKTCNVLLMPCKDSDKYPLCPRVSNMREWADLLKLWIYDKEEKIKSKTTKKLFQDVDKSFKTLAPLSSGGKRKKYMKKITRKNKKVNHNTRKMKKK
jgi:hypothetical protein